MNSVAEAQFAPDTELDLGVAGASARRRHERVAEQLGWAGGLAVETGAEGEEELAVHLATTCPEAVVLHDRALPGCANIDHLAIAPNGVWVIAAPRYAGRIEVRGRLRGERRLLIADRERPDLVAGLSHHRDLVRAAIDPVAPELPVHACFCFLGPAHEVGAGPIPALRTLRVDGLPIYRPGQLSKQINSSGALSRDSAGELASLLAASFPRA